MEAAAPGRWAAPVKITGASRTDAGVHALRQVASLATSVRGRAGRAPARAQRAPAARRCACSTRARRRPASTRGARPAASAMLYLIDRAAPADPFLAALRLARPVPARRRRDGGAGSRAARQARLQRFLRGGRPRIARPPARYARRGWWPGGSGLRCCLSADSFLHHMVRNIVGSLVEVGRGARRARLDGEVVDGRDRKRAGPTAPAQGLALVRVLYGPEARARPRRGGHDAEEPAEGARRPARASRRGSARTMRWC